MITLHQTSHGEYLREFPVYVEQQEAELFPSSAAESRGSLGSCMFSSFKWTAYCQVLTSRSRALTETFTPSSETQTIARGGVMVTRPTIKQVTAAFHRHRSGCSTSTPGRNLGRGGAPLTPRSTPCLSCSVSDSPFGDFIFCLLSSFFFSAKRRFKTKDKEMKWGGWKSCDLLSTWDSQLLWWPGLNFGLAPYLNLQFVNNV